MTVHVQTERPRYGFAMTSTWNRGWAGMAILGLLISGCGQDTSTADAQTSITPSESAQEQTTNTNPEPTTESGSAMSTESGSNFVTPTDSANRYASVAGSCSEKPTLKVKVGATGPSDLLVLDVCPGMGPVVKPGAYVTAHYIGTGLKTGQVFDSSWARGKSIQFPLTGVIAGWSEGIPGMRVGGRRLLVIPGNLAYGPNPPTTAILPNETLVFVVDIISSP